MKKKVLALNVHSGTIKINGGKTHKIILPDGCDGICFIFKSIKQATDFWGNNLTYIEIENDGEERDETI